MLMVHTLCRRCLHYRRRGLENDAERRRLCFGCGCYCYYRHLNLVYFWCCLPLCRDSLLDLSGPCPLVHLYPGCPAKLDYVPNASLYYKLRPTCYVYIAPLPWVVVVAIQGNHLAKNTRVIQFAKISAVRRHNECVEINPAWVADVHG